MRGAKKRFNAQDFNHPSRIPLCRAPETMHGVCWNQHFPFSLAWHLIYKKTLVQPDPNTNIPVAYNLQNLPHHPQN
jgi:hypothetical protein